MVERQVESELKYEVSAVTRPPWFVQRTARPGDEHLDATYFDTADGSLSARHVIVRRRRGGHDAGWHVKFPAAGADRIEHRWPDGETPPAELLDLVGVAALQPVARLRTHRRRLHLLAEDGGVLAEFADDRVRSRDLVHGVRRHWREWELELGPAAPSEPAARTLLLATLDATIGLTGATRSALPSKFVRATAPSAPGIVIDAVADLVARLDAAEAAAIADEEDAVHQARVLVRRLRSVLAAYRRHFDRRRVDALRADLRGLGIDLGRVRDLEVRARRAEEWRSSSAEDWAAYREAHHGLVKILVSARHRRLGADLQGFVDDPHPHLVSDPDPAPVLLEDLAQACERVRRAAERVDGSLASLHEVRKAARRVRYAAQMHLTQPGPRGPSVFDDATLARLTSLAAAAEGVQDVLGEHRDDVVFADYLVEHGETEAAQRCRERARARLDEYPEVLRRFLPAAQSQAAGQNQAAGQRSSS